MEFQYEVTLGTGTVERPADRIDRIPRFGPRVEGSPSPVPQPGLLVMPGGGPLTGGTLAARFTLSVLDPRGVYDVRVKDGKTVLARTGLDLARLR